MKKISIIIPTYNRANLLPIAIRSVVDQTYQNWELIIVDDGSIDNTKEVVTAFSEPRIKYYYQKNAGVASAMNTGFQNANGDYFAWLDSDNYYNTDTFQKVIETFEKDSSIETSIDVVYGNVELTDGKKIVKTFKPRPLINYKTVLLHTSGSVPVQPAVFFKGHYFSDVNGFNTAYRIAGDIDFWVKVLKLRPNLKYIDQTFGYYLIDDKAISQGLRGIKNGLKEMHVIFKGHNQPLYGKFLLNKKYATGYVWTLIKSILKNKKHA